MPRKKRKWHEGAYLHVIARGNHRSDIFREKTDYELYLNYLEEANVYYDYKYHIVAYTLMTNHVHLIIKTEDKEISDFIKRVHSRYAWNFNKKYDYVGHLFQDRYKSELIDTDKYLLESSRYIHLNPVKAKMVELPQDYKWSSYNQYIGKTKDRIVECDKILSYFKKDNCKELYKDFVENINRKTGIDICNEIVT